MEKPSTLRALLGITQTEMAYFAGVSRSLWNLHERGLRSLPLAAQQRVATLVTSMAQTGRVKNESKKEVRDGMGQHVNRLLKENEYQLMHAGREIIGAEKKLAAEKSRIQMAALHVAAHDGKPAQPLLRKPSVAACLNRETELAKLKLHEEFLVVERKFLEGKLVAFAGK